jgi:hypothetical protein
MKKFALLAAVATLGTASPAAAVFTLNNDLGGDGFVQVNSPTSFTIFGADDGTDGNITSYSTIAAALATITGTWSYSTQDVDGSSFDPAGFFVNSVFTQLSTNDIPAPALQGGAFTFTVNPGDTWGFYVATTDGALGRGSLTVNLGAAIPEPQSWAMLIAGFGLVGAAMRRRRLAAAA